jgi:flagellar FliJ protein
MGFQFSLETVLRVRGIVEEREERMLQQITFEISQTKERLAQIDAEITGLDAARRADVLKPSIGHNIHASYGELKALKQSREDQRAKVEKLEQLRKRQVAVYEAAHRNREMLTDMHDEKRNAYESDMARREQKTIDDNFIARRGHC